MRFPATPRVLVLSFLALMGCVSAPETPVGPAGTGPTGLHASSPVVTPSGGGFSPNPAASTGASPIPVGGQDDPARLSQIDIASLSVSALTVAPQTLTLCVPPENPTLGSAGYLTRALLDVRLTLSNQTILDGDVVFVSSNPEVVNVEANGATYYAVTQGGARPTATPVVLTGTSRKDPTRTVTVRVTVVDDAAAIVDLE